MDTLKSLVQPLLGAGASSSMIDGMKLVVLGGTVETARRMSSSACLLPFRASRLSSLYSTTSLQSEEDMPYDWLMLWLSRRPEWQRSREFETTTSSSSPGFYGYRESDDMLGEEEEDESESLNGKRRTRVVFQPTQDTTHTIFYRGHWLRVRRSRKSNGYEQLTISVIARNNSILKQLVLQAKKEYEAEAVHRIQIYFADSYGSWRWTDSRHKRPLSSIVLNPGVKEMLISDTKDFLKSEKWYADRGIPFRRGYLLYGVPGSGKSSLIHAIAGELMLDIYVVSLSSSWINDSTLTTLMGRVPSRCIVLLEDLDAAFTRSTNRQEKSKKEKEKEKKKDNDSDDETTTTATTHRSRRHRSLKADNLSDVNTLTLSGLLNALDGVAASEGRLLFATTNHLERLDPALCRPGRMDVWIEFKNASKWQAKALFRNFFPSADADAAADDAEALEIPPPPSPTSSTFSTLFSDAFSGLSSASGSQSPSLSSTSISRQGSVRGPSTPVKTEGEQYLPPTMEEHLAACAQARKPLSAARLEQLATDFAEAIPDEEFSVAALQGYLLKNKSRPETAASEAAAWVISERQLREKLRKEREARKLEEEKEVRPNTPSLLACTPLTLL
ncbi:P-loop containing nucleoside triphosphate hydrolase protein [Vararia minispora EC-137]|uniref:P-loop containing nucleoside triphosphate hydrolase protein n=1 Tax=Vararia minispora EC-137 TaxID=1314806 RepID=A0ACB8QNT8_9AGAM|nr:P-loop containing nucleoside triphosphate hydrolase protein [Vararia minispora EC-137]